MSFTTILNRPKATKSPPTPAEVYGKLVPSPKRPTGGHEAPTVAGTFAWFRQCVERGRDGVFSEATLVTPGLAKTLLESHNPNNRNIRQKVGQFARDMKAGRWAFNGEAIIISKEGLINTGQHRLQGVVLANVTVPMMFTFGIARETRTTTDQGIGKTAANYLEMDGQEYCAGTTSIARVIMGFERGGGETLFRESDISNTEIIERVYTDPDILTAAKYASSVYRYTKALAPASLIGAAYYLLSQVNPAQAREYMDSICYGEGLRRGDPALAVRNTLLNLGRTIRAKKLEAIFRGWVKYRAKQPLQFAKILGTFPDLD